MKRWLGFSICTALGVALFVCGLRIPIYLRAVDAVVLQRAGKNTSSLADFGLKLVNDKNLGAAQLILQTAQTEKISGWEKLGATVTDSVNAHPDWEVWGGDVRWNQFFEKNLNAPANSEPFTAFAIREQNRDSILQALRQSSNPATLELLRTRALNDTVLFPPSQSASGQAYDAAVAIAGLLTEGGYLTASLSGDISKLAAAANQGHGTRPLEEVLMDLLSLGQRLNWNQLVTFVNQIADVPTLHLLADQARKSGHELPLLFSAVTISSQPDGVAKYLSNYNATGFGDLAAGLHFGAGGLQELLARDQRIYHSGNLPQVGLSLSLRAPWLAFALKWFLYLVAGFLFAASLHFVKPAVSSLERPLQVRGFHVFREILFALGFLLVVLLLSEPFLAQENQKETFSFRLHLPT
ncbi:MAG TPA: hypothetical protein VHG89_07435, partial [Verrucomicrobiae bacterium]|nr:hypothetical protein [Verrucomicrobiae bacterium]